MHTDTFSDEIESGIGFMKIQQVNHNIFFTHASQCTFYSSEASQGQKAGFTCIGHGFSRRHVLNFLSTESYAHRNTA
jgi:hypothetical protein